MTDASLQFEIQPSSGLPIYRQIMDQVRALLVSGHLRSGDMLPSIRQLASDLEVNMMTVSKAYARLESEGILERVRGTGMRVRDVSAPGSLADRKSQLQPMMDALVTRALQLNLSEAQILAVLRAALKERQAWLK